MVKMVCPKCHMMVNGKLYYGYLDFRSPNHPTIKCPRCKAEFGIQFNNIDISV